LTGEYVAFPNGFLTVLIVLTICLRFLILR
jgi:hypothetical protein